MPCGLCLSRSPLGASRVPFLRTCVFMPSREQYTSTRVVLCVGRVHLSSIPRGIFIILFRFRIRYLVLAMSIVQGPKAPSRKPGLCRTSDPRHVMPCVRQRAQCSGCTVSKDPRKSVLSATFSVLFCSVLRGDTSGQTTLESKLRERRPHGPTCTFALQRSTTALRARGFPAYPWRPPTAARSC